MLKKLFIAFVFMVLAAAPAYGADPADDNGVFKIYYLGELVGAEKYTIRYTPGGGYTAEGNTSIKEDDTKIEMLNELVFGGEKVKLETYQAEIFINDLPKKLALKFDGAKAQVAIATGTRTIQKEIELLPTVMVVEPLSFHHLKIILDRYSIKVGGVQRFYVFKGTELKAVDVTVEDRGPDPAVLSYGAFRARRLFVNLDDVGLSLWVDGKGRLLKVENRMQGYMAELEAYKGTAAKVPDSVNPHEDDPELIYERVRFASGELTLAGTLTRPRTASGKLPAVVFVSRDGPQDRNGTVPYSGINIGTARMMNDLSRTGVVVLRYDDRGVGESGGSLATETFSARVDDAAAAVDFLKSRPEVDPKRIGLVGHGEGGNAALVLAGKRKDLSAVALLAASAIPLDELALQQARKRLQQQGPAGEDELKQTPIYIAISRARETDTKWTVIGRKNINLDLFREWGAMTPKKDLVKVRAKVLIAQGGQDQQVFPENGEALHDAAQAAGMGNVTYEKFPKLDHFFVRSRGTIGEYSDPDRRPHPDFVRTLSEWLRENL